MITLSVSTLFSTFLVSAQSLPRRQADVIPSQVHTMTEKGLRFLKTTQNAQGAWSGRNGTRPGVIGLCVVAFLASGEDPNVGQYSQNILQSLRYIISKQDSTGYIGPQMYDHGFATLALAEAYGVVDDATIAPALEKAVKLILEAQKRNSRNAWRYTPVTQYADTTVTGCQIKALMAARNAGIEVPDQSISQALAYMKSCRNSSGAYGYTSRSGARLTLTAIGSLCWSLAKKQDEEGFDKTTNYLVKNIRSMDSNYPFYFRYYMSQALFQANQEKWEAWNKDNIRVLSASQLPDGSWAGKQGSVFSTAGALLSLALNYRFLPIYEK